MKIMKKFLIFALAFFTGSLAFSLYNNTNNWKVYLVIWMFCATLYLKIKEENI